jgi:hypothetical protein
MQEGELGGLCLRNFHCCLGRFCIPLSPSDIAYVIRNA